MTTWRSMPPVGAPGWVRLVSCTIVYTGRERCFSCAIVYTFRNICLERGDRSAGGGRTYILHEKIHTIVRRWLSRNGYDHVLYCRCVASNVRFVDDSHPISPLITR
jgi:hypothetical protein